MLIQESDYLKRRVHPNELEPALVDALNYALIIFRKKPIPENLEEFFNDYADTVISLVIDDIHPKLTEYSTDFPYQEISQYLLERFYPRILNRFTKEFGPL